jgi:hypothetical protein
MPITKGTKSYFYFNLHKRVWSLMVRGRVVSHATDVYARNVEFRVRPAGRARVLREGRKNVHAFAVADWASVASDGVSLTPVRVGADDWEEVSYNPFRSDKFHRKIDGKPVRGAAEAVLTLKGGRGRVYARGLKFFEPSPIRQV